MLTKSHDPPSGLLGLSIDKRICTATNWVIQRKALESRAGLRLRKGSLNGN